MAMTAGQFFLYLLIIIILKESLASATVAMEASISSSTSSGSVSASASAGSWPIGEDGSSMLPAVNMGVRRYAAPPFVSGKLICFARGECFTIPGVGQYHVELSRRWGWENS